jgi:hypothetical protein
MANNETKPFTFSDAFIVQTEGVARMAKILNNETYIKLLNEVAIRNEKGYESPYDVCRGQDIIIIAITISYQS